MLTEHWHTMNLVQLPISTSGPLCADSLIPAGLEPSAPVSLQPVKIQSNSKDISPRSLQTASRRIG